MTIMIIMSTICRRFILFSFSEIEKKLFEKNYKRNGSTKFKEFHLLDLDQYTVGPKRYLVGLKIPNCPPLRPMRISVWPILLSLPLK